MVLACLALVCFALERISYVVVLFTVSLSTKCKAIRPVMPQVVSNLLPMLDLVRACIGARTNGFIILDPKVDASD